MPIFGDSVAKSSSLVPAALETAGAAIQSDMLDFVNGASGQTLAGLLFLIAIMTALIMFAIGGNYRWARYFLVGPPLFFFLTQVRTDSDGTQWSFANEDFPREAVEKALRGMDAPGNGGGGTQVALFYNFWNVFLSETNQQLMKMLNLNADDSHLSFIQKFERYMQLWNFNQIKDSDVRMLIRVTLVNQCAGYFGLLRAIHQHDVDPLTKAAYQQAIKDNWEKKVIFFVKPGERYAGDAEMAAWLEKNKVEGAFTCQQMWEKVITLLRPQVANSIDHSLNENLQPNQEFANVKKAFLKRTSEYTSRASGLLAIPEGEVNQDAAFIAAVDWVIARSMWHEIWQRNPYTEAYGMEGHSGVYQSGLGYAFGAPSGYNETTSSNIRQFNTTDVYAERSEFVNAALSLPYFQGLGLLLLSAAYPFFAMAVVMPGRAGAMFLWMGLWAWLKLWDLGFAVVMMIDNMLYAMFPRGPSLEAQDINNAGLAWAKIMEIDPNYAQATYYNLIATCLFAVPVATAFFVKGGGGELVNLIHGGWTDTSARLAGAAASFARSMQAQGYMKNLQEQSFRYVSSEMTKRAIQLLPDMNQNQQRALAEAFNKGAGMSALNPMLSGMKDAERARISAEIRAAGKEAHYRISVSEAGRFASESAVAARYYSHDLAAGHPGKASYQAYLSQGFINKEQVVSGTMDAAIAPALKALSTVANKASSPFKGGAEAK